MIYNNGKKIPIFNFYATILQHFISVQVMYFWGVHPGGAGAGGCTLPTINQCSKLSSILFRKEMSGMTFLLNFTGQFLLFN